MQLDQLKQDELMWVRCPAMVNNDRAQNGMTKEFLEMLGVTDPKIVNMEVDLIFEYMIAF